MAISPAQHTAAYGIHAYTLAATRPQGQQAPTPFTLAAPAPPAEAAADTVTLSQRGKSLSASGKTPDRQGQTANGTPARTTGESSTQPQTEAELRQIRTLQRRDAQVRAHEQAHLSAAGQYAAGGPSYSYQTGANGKRYAVGGSVPIDMKEESTPEATIMKMRTVKRAALAPADPSATDRQVAAQAGAKEMVARQELQASLQAQTNTATTTAAIGGQPAPSPQNAGTMQSAPPESSSGTKHPPEATRALMSAAYKAMASLS